MAVISGALRFMTRVIFILCKSRRLTLPELVLITELEGVCDSKTQLRAEREQPKTATIHVANALMNNDTLLCVVISAYPGIEIAQQYDFVVRRAENNVS